MTATNEGREGPEVLWSGEASPYVGDARIVVTSYSATVEVIYAGQWRGDNYAAHFVAAHLARQLAASEAALAEARVQLAELPILREGANQAAEMAFHLPVAGRLVDRFFLWQKERKEEREKWERANADLRRRMAAARALVDELFAKVPRPRDATVIASELRDLLHEGK